MWKVLNELRIEKSKPDQSINGLCNYSWQSKDKLKNYLVDKVRKLDFVILPWCFRVLLKKMKRLSYIARLWRNCLSVNPQDQIILFFDWRDDHYNIQCFDGDAAPKIADVDRQCEGTQLKSNLKDSKNLLAFNALKRVILLQKSFSKLTILN